MLSNIWDTVLYGPLLNALAFLVSIIPGGDVGLAVIIAEMPFPETTKALIYNIFPK